MTYVANGFAGDHGHDVDKAEKSEAMHCVVDVEE